jgi:hypothetical protein
MVMLPGTSSLPVVCHPDQASPSYPLPARRDHRHRGARIGKPDDGRLGRVKTAGVQHCSKGGCQNHQEDHHT